MEPRAGRRKGRGGTGGKGYPRTFGIELGPRDSIPGLCTGSTLVYVYLGPRDSMSSLSIYHDLGLCNAKQPQQCLCRRVEGVGKEAGGRGKSRVFLSAPLQEGTEEDDRGQGTLSMLLLICLHAAQKELLLPTNEAGHSVVNSGI